MLRLRKMAIACTLSVALMLGSSSVFAASLEDTADLPAEVSINKLVSLGVLKSNGNQYNPDGALTRGDFVNALTRIMKLNNSAKSVTIKDIGAKSADYNSVSKVVGNGLLKLDGKGNFKPKQAVTYAEFSRALANGLGLKLSWTDRPIDYLFYLERKGVLSLDTDLDAVVTRAEAATAIDQYAMLKKLFTSDTGVITELKSDGIVLNNGSENLTYKFADNAALFLSGQNEDPARFQPGTLVELLLNDNDEIAFMAGNSYNLVSGTIVYTDGMVKVNDTLKNINLSAVVKPLINNPTENFTFSNFGAYGLAGVTYGGGVYVNNKSDEVTRFDAYMAKIEGMPFELKGSQLTVDFSGVALSNQTFNLAEEIKVTLKAKTEAEKDKEVKLDELTALQSGNTLSGTLEINADGEVTAITATSEPKAAT